jgi:hypothetical protein
MDTFFAIQLQPGESPHLIAALVLRTAAEAKIRFGRLDIMSTFRFGSRDFVRFQSSVLNPFPVLDRLLLWGRASIACGPGSYLLRTPSGQDGPVPLTHMHTAANPLNFRSYQGVALAS